MKRQRYLPICLGLTASLAVSSLSAQPSVSSSPFQTSQPAKAPVMLAQNGNVEMYLMIEQLQQEVRELRGMVEQQAYSIEQLKAQQRDRYMDLDQRILNLDKRLAGQGSAPESEPSAQSQTASPTDAMSPATDANAKEEIATSGATATDAQKREYQQAYDLIRQRQFDKAVDALHGFISRHPNSDLTVNAYYWLGEVYLVMPKLEQAKQAFTVVVSRYQNHRKASDAYYKLGVTLDRMGDSQQARQFLNMTVQKYPGSAAAGLAQDYLRKLQ